MRKISFHLARFVEKRARWSLLQPQLSAGTVSFQSASSTRPARKSFRLPKSLLLASTGSSRCNRSNPYLNGPKHISFGSQWPLKTGFHFNWSSRSFFQAVFVFLKAGITGLALVSLFLGTSGLFTSPAYADVPKMLNYQGRMTDSSDNLVDGTTYYYQFEIYDDPSAGSRLWASYDDFDSTCGVAITPSNGVFNTIIGDPTVNNMSDFNINFDADPYYLQIKISADQSNNVACEGTLGSGASYETLSPRQRIVSSGFAFTARKLSGDYDESITNPTDDYLAFSGSGGADNTDVYFDLDGTYPVVYSNTDTAIGIDDNLTFVGAQSITTSTGDLTIQPASGNSLNISLSTTGDFVVNTNQLVVDTSATNVGIGDTGPDAKLEILAASGAQLKLTNTDTVDEVDFTVDGNGDLTIDASGGDVTLSSGDNLNLTASTDLIFGGTTSLGETTGATDSGGYMVGVYDEFAQSAGNDVQTVLDDIDQAVTDLVNGDSGLWRDGGAYIYPNNVGTSFQIADTSGNLTLPGTLDVSGTTTIADTSPPDLVLDNTTTGADADSGRLYFRGNEYTGPSTNTELDMSILLDIVSTSDYKLAFYNDGAGTEVATLDESGNLQLDGVLDVDGGGTNDIAGTLNLSGGALTSTGALTITPAAGSNLAIALSTTGDFVVNTDDLVVDTSAGYVGIGTTGPAYTLDVNGSGRFGGALYADAGINTTSGNLTLDSSGGTTSVADNLEVTGNTTSAAGYADFGSYLRASEVRSEGDVYVNYDGADGDSNLYFYEGGAATGEYLRWDDVTGYGDGTGFYLSDDLELAGNIRKNVASSDLIINSAGASSGVIFQTGGSDKVTISANGDLTLNNSTYGFVTFGELASAPSTTAARQYYNTTDDMMYYYDGNVTDWRSMQGVSSLFIAPEYPNSVSACVSGNCTGTLATGYELSSNVLYTFYRWRGSGTGTNMDLGIHLKIPDNFVSWASNAITLNYKTESNVAGDNWVDWYLYEDGNGTALCSATNLNSTSWTTSSFTTGGCANLSNLTAGDTFYIRIRLNDNSGDADAAYVSKITLYYQ